jgi:hypothetical protein|tara:strand:- start:2391 stop:3239 length:849 start_codon:yes stop_codon:yes gene_type:complete
MTKHTILIGLPRTGTTWVHSYIRQYYENNNYGIVLPDIVKTIKDEILDIGVSMSFLGAADEWLDHEGYKDKEKIEFFEACRRCGLEVCHKVFANSLAQKYENTNILNWFKDFYRDTDVIILRRKNLWKTYISYLFHFTISNQLETKEDNGKFSHPWHAEFNTHTNTFVRSNNEANILDKTIQTNNIEFKHNEKIWNKFLWNIRFLNNNVINELPNAELIWTEDLSDKILTERFGGPPEELVKPFQNMDYEKYYSKKELKIMKEKYYQIFRNEFTKHGYISGI